MTQEIFQENLFPAIRPIK